MGDTPKQDWAEKMADRIVVSIDKLSRAHAMNDARAAEDERTRLWVEVKAMIFALDVRTHVKPD